MIPHCCRPRRQGQSSIRYGCGSRTGSTRSAMLMMIGSGWQIYNASPLFGFMFPNGVTLGGWLAGALLWHFAAMWLWSSTASSMSCSALQPAVSAASFCRSIRARSLPITAALRVNLTHDDSPLQRRAEAPISRRHPRRHRHRSVGPLDLEARATAGAHGVVRRLRRGALRAFLRHGHDRGFLVLHVIMALLVPKSLRAMIPAAEETPCRAPAKPFPASIRSS